MIRRVSAVVLFAAHVCGHVSPAFAYLKLGVDVNGRSVSLKWPGAATYFVTERSAPGVSPLDLQAAIGRAFSTWQNVATASVTYRFGGFTAALPIDDDGQSTLGFVSRPELERVLASTSFTVDETTGALIESDIFFNSAFQWSVATAGEANKYDLESIALHEIGHFSGLGHSALGETELVGGGGRRVLGAESVMFPIAFPAGNVLGRVLRADDIAGISDLYPDGGFAQQTGSLSGTVTRNGAGLFGAHVIAFNLGSGALVANFTLTATGQFTIAGLSPGPYAVRVEPLDDADVGSFFSVSVDVNFKPAFGDRLVVVPKGGDSGNVNLTVVGK